MTGRGGLRYKLVELINEGLLLQILVELSI